MSTSIVKNILVINGGERGNLTGMHISAALRNNGKRDGIVVTDTHTTPYARSDGFGYDDTRADLYLNPHKPSSVGHCLKHARPDIVVITPVFAQSAAAPSFKRNALLLLEACRNCTVIFISCSSVLSGADGNHTEKTPPSPKTQHAERVVFLEGKVQEIIGSRGLIVRPGFLYGTSTDRNIDPHLSLCRDTIRSSREFLVPQDIDVSPVSYASFASIVARLALHSERWVGRHTILHIAGTQHASRMPLLRFYTEAMAAIGESQDDCSLIQPLHPDATWIYAADEHCADDTFLSNNTLRVHFPDLYDLLPETVDAGLALN